MGLVGKGSPAERLRSILETGGIRLETLAVESGFQTILKTRIIARQQQVVRVDHERPHAVSPASLERCLAQITEMLPELDGIIFEDYGKGFVVQSFVDQVTQLARATGKVVTADPDPRGPDRVETSDCGQGFEPAVKRLRGSKRSLAGARGRALNRQESSRKSASVCCSDGNRTRF